VGNGSHVVPLQLVGETARKMVKSGELGTISHMLVRFNQPGIQRYIDEAIRGC
jgi:hypothetical protein